MSHHTELTPSATTSQAYLATPSTLTNNSWLVDSGATHHVTSNDNSMISKTEDKGYEKLAIGNGDILEFCTGIVHLEKKNLKYNAGFKNMPKLVRLGMGGNGRHCERRPLANLKADVHNGCY